MREIGFNIGGFKTNVIISKDVFLPFPRRDDVLYVFDENTFSLFKIPEGISFIVIPPGEKYKTMGTIEKITSRALDKGLARDSLFVGIGGGVVCDLTAFAASIYMRGAELVLVPTTLLAMTDASLGGKTGTDYRGYKNILGTFYPARELYIFPNLLSSLSEREFKSGLGEVIKHALLRDTGLFGLLKSKKEKIFKGDPELLSTVVELSLGVKGWYVEKDFREKDVRRHLNFGHTFGHALESVTGFTSVSHGEAVMWGIAMALKAGSIMGVTDESWVGSVMELIRLYGYRDDLHKGIDARELVSAISHDKKKKGGDIFFVLQRGQGDTFTTPLADEILFEVLS